MLARIAGIVGLSLLAGAPGQAAPAPAGGRPLLESANIESVQRPRPRRIRIYHHHFGSPWRDPWIWRLQYEIRGADVPGRGW
jgi:hypothetical protein